MRSDGRKRSDYRPMELETDVVTHANGSARLRLANTDILVGVKTEIDSPHLESPNMGKIEFFVDWYASSISIGGMLCMQSSISSIFSMVDLHLAWLNNLLNSIVRILMVDSGHKN